MKKPNGSACAFCLSRDHIPAHRRRRHGKCNWTEQNSQSQISSDEFSELRQPLFGRPASHRVVAASPWQGNLTDLAPEPATLDPQPWRRAKHDHLPIPETHVALFSFATSRKRNPSLHRHYSAIVYATYYIPGGRTEAAWAQAAKPSRADSDKM